MVTAIIIFFCASLYAFADYYKSQELKDLGFAIILFIGAIATLIQTIDDNEQSDNIEKLSQLDTALSKHIDTLVTIDTALSNKTNNLSNQSILIGNQNKDLLNTVELLTKESRSLIKSVNEIVKHNSEENLQSGELKMNFSKTYNENDDVFVTIGGMTAGNTVKALKNGSGLFIIGDKDPISIHFDNKNRILISIDVYDLFGNLIAEINDNNWRPNKNFTGKFNYNDTSFEVINNQGEVAISIDFLQDNRIILKGIFPFKDAGIIWFCGKRTISDYFAAPYIRLINDLKNAEINPIFKYTGNDWLHKRVE